VKSGGSRQPRSSYTYVVSGSNSATTLTSTNEDFLAWSTTRLPWRQLVSIDGDQAVAAEFLDALNLI
jgi:hypothetical protein